MALVNAKVARDRSTRSPGLHKFCSYGGTTYTAVSKTVALGRLGLSPSRSTKFYGSIGERLTHHTANVAKPKGCPSSNLGASAIFR